VLERYERERRNGPLAPGVPWWSCTPTRVTDADDVVRDALVARMNELYPETVARTIVDERLLRRADCPRFAPGDFARRPTVQTPDPRIVLAGDGIRIDLPVALMERAATTGWVAANICLSGLAGRTRGAHRAQSRPLALLRRLATRAGGERR